MHLYLGIIESAVFTFPLLALVCSVPYMVHEYRKFGSIPVWKTTLVFTFIFYLLCAFYLVLLPLPADRTAYYAATAHPQLVPFNEMVDVNASLARVGFSLGAPATWLAALKQPAVYQLLFNFALTMPFGAFIHYFWERPWWQAWLAGLGLALVFETTQLTGIWGIYEHPYRLFDVDDLIVNSTGSLLGWLVATPFCRLLPDLDVVNAHARERGRRYPSFIRRAVAFAVDMVLVVVIAVIVVPDYDLFASLSSTALSLALGFAIVFMVLPCLTGGRTPGHALLRMRVVRTSGAHAAWWRVVIRYALLCWVILMGPLWLYVIFPSASVDGASFESVAVVAMAVYSLWMMSVLLRALADRLHNMPFIMANGLVTDTCIMTDAQIEALRCGYDDETDITSEPGTYQPHGYDDVASEPAGATDDVDEPDETLD